MDYAIADLSPLEQKLSFTFSDFGLLRRALTHKSYINEQKDKTLQDNERLEFLGDAVLDLIISDTLMARYPEAKEGDLSKMKANIVSEGTLAAIANGLDLGGFLFLGKGEDRTEGRGKNSLLSDALEAVIAAMYLDQGFSSAKASVLTLFMPFIKNLTPLATFDYKTAMQEFCQKAFGVLPTYRVIQESGPDHQKMFEVAIEIHGTSYGTGTGRSKKEAEQMAAHVAMDQLQKKAR